jgi:DNA-binding response OmpR family regulator
VISVLCVDDETDLLDLTKRFLEKTGKFSVTITESPSHALEKIKKTPYDAIVSDYQMPEMNGIELLSSIRGSGNSTPFILFTGKGCEEVLIQALKNGADSYVQKLGNPHLLYTKLMQHIVRAVELHTVGNSLTKGEQTFKEIVILLADNVCDHC